MRAVALLRAVNTGGRRVTNDALADSFRAFGLSGVATYQAAGNVVFDAPATVTGEWIADLEAHLEAALGWPVPVVVRTVDELAALCTRVPFTAAEVASSGAKPQVMFLSAPVAVEDADRVQAAAPPAERLVVDGADLHWLPAGGVGGSEFDHASLARLVGPFTVRTLGTIERLVQRFS